MSDIHHSAGLLVLVTARCEQAEALARGMVKAELAACVNIVPTLKSIYRWQGQVHTDDESLLLIKTQRACFEALRTWVLDQHSYELPEIIAVEISHAHEPYLEWMIHSTSVPS